MRKPLILVIGILMAIVTIVSMFCPLFILYDYNIVWETIGKTSYNMFDILKGRPFYLESQIIGIVSFVAMIAGVACTITGAIFCFDNVRPKKVLSVVGASLLMVASFVMMIFGIVSPQSFGKAGITFGEFYFIVTASLSVYFMYLVCKKD